MADIIDFPQEQGDSQAGDQLDNDSFLLKEGLELLAHYRSIKDADVRASIMRLVATLSRSES